MRIFVTGAGGFVGKWLCLELLSRGHEVLGAVRTPEDVDAIPDVWRDKLRDVSWLAVEMLDAVAVEEALRRRPDAVIHLAAVSSGSQARSQPVMAWGANVLGTCTLVYAMERLGIEARLVLASTGEVYGAELTRPARETDPVRPISPYAASKAAAEEAVMEYHRRLGSEVVIARPFAQTGPGQREQFVVAAFIHRILNAQREGASEVTVGNLEPIREFMDVRDVTAALSLLAESERADGVYNIATGAGTSLQELFALIRNEVGWTGEPHTDSQLLRKGDVPYLVGDGARIIELGWSPDYDLRATIRDTIEDARAHLNY